MPGESLKAYPQRSSLRADRTSNNFQCFINYLEGDAQRLLPKPANITRPLERWLVKRWGQWCGEIWVTGLRLPKSWTKKLGMQQFRAKGKPLSRELGKDAEVEWTTSPTWVWYCSETLQLKGLVGALGGWREELQTKVWTTVHKVWFHRWSYLDKYFPLFWSLHFKKKS